MWRRTSNSPLFQGSNGESCDGLKNMLKNLISCYSKLDNEALNTLKHVDPSICIVFIYLFFLFIKALQNNSSAEGLQDTRSYSLLKMVS